jgi:hypothetical protein
MLERDLQKEFCSRSNIVLVNRSKTVHVALY